MSVNPTEISAADVVRNRLTGLNAADINMGGTQEMLSNLLTYIKDFFKEHGIRFNVSADDVFDTAKDYASNSLSKGLDSMKPIMNAFKAAATDGVFDKTDFKNIATAWQEEAPAATEGTPAPVTAPTPT